MRGLLVLLLLASCTQKSSQAVCVLVDTSGTYTDQIPEILQQVRLVLLPPMSGGDQLILMKIDSFSYGWDNVVAILDVPASRGEAANSKRLFSSQMDEAQFERAKYTDISGAILYCNEYMRNTDCKTRKILIYSDMQEELPPEVTRSFRENELEGMSVAVVNTKRLVGDQRDPESYRKRMDEWQAKMREYGATGFHVFMSPDKVRSFMEVK